MNFELLIPMLAAMFYIIAFLVTRYYYRIHVAYLRSAVSEGKVRQDSVEKERKWFRKASLGLLILALGAVFIPDSWLVPSVFLSLTIFVIAASASESMIIIDAKHDQDESSYGSA